MILIFVFPCYTALIHADMRIIIQPSASCQSREDKQSPGEGTKGWWLDLPKHMPLYYALHDLFSSSSILQSPLYFQSCYFPIYPCYERSCMDLTFPPIFMAFCILFSYFINDLNGPDYPICCVRLMTIYYYHDVSCVLFIIPTMYLQYPCFSCKFYEGNVALTVSPDSVLFMRFNPISKPRFPPFL